MDSRARPSPVRIRTAVDVDALGVAVVRMRSWRAAYAGVIPDHVLDGMDLERMADQVRARMADPADPFTTRVAERAGAIVGFTVTGPYRGDDAPAGTGEVLAIYADPDHWSTGVGRLLMTDALDRLAASCLSPVLLWVLRDNPRARRFYHRMGFAPDGAEHFYVAGGVPVPEVRYRHA